MLALPHVIDAARPSPQTLATSLHVALLDPDGALYHAPHEATLNPEWDLMANLYLVLALGNEALADPSRETAALAEIDAILEGTLHQEATHGPHSFLLPYGRARAFVDPGGRSVFVDGEIAMMLATRLQVAEDPRWHAMLGERIVHIDAAMERGPIGSAESYPNECWTFCNTTALAAMTLADPILGTDHRARVQAWLASAKAHLIDEETGLLVASYTWDGQTLDGPEGSTIWMVAHNLLLLDETFARDQYTRAREHLGRTASGLGWAREWPSTFDTRPDVDSGAVVPIVEASPGASGLAVLGAAAFDDESYRAALLRSLEFAASPEREGEQRWYGAAGRIGNAVVLYALRFGPLWARAQGRSA